MSYETLIHQMIDEIECPSAMSKYSVIERYFKKVHEDTKKECTEVIENSGAYDGIKRTIIYRIGKL